jgi:4-hydroxybenzoate polyprenyltransferase
MARRVLLARHDLAPLGQQWIYAFKKRHPELTTAAGAPLESKRVNGATPDILKTYFDRLRALIDRKRIKEENIWNVDESGFAMGDTRSKTVLVPTARVQKTNKRRKTRTVAVSSPQNRAWVSMVECISAGGRMTSPLAIFAGKQHQESWYSCEIPDWHFAVSPNAFTDKELSLLWLESIFIPQTATLNGQWRLLILDGLKQHVQDDFIDACLTNRIEVFYLPAHTSHVTQPLDLACFSPLKASYRDKIAALAALDNSAPVKRQRFLRYYREAREERLTPKNIAAGWKAAGIVPWNPQRVIESPRVVAEERDEQTPPRTPSPSLLRPPELVQVPIATPRSQRLMRSSLAQLDPNCLNREARSLLHRTGRYFDQLSAQNAELQKQNEHLRAIIDELQKSKSRKKLETTPNTRVVSRRQVIEALGAAPATATANEAAEEPAKDATPEIEQDRVNMPILRPQEQYMSSWRLDTSVCVNNSS